jgi:large subunit ribosomal protein L15
VPEELNLSNLKPAQGRVDRKRIGRGLGSGKGRYSGRGIKGQKSRAGSHAMRAGFEGGQMPIYMRLGKLRGATSKDAMPIGPFRTYTVPVNVRDLDRFDDGATVTPESLVEKRLIKNTKVDVKILGDGELAKKLTVSVHAVSASAREKIEAAGGTITLLREPKEKKRRPKKAKETSAQAAPETTKAAKRKRGEPDEAVDAEPTDREAIAEAVEEASADESAGPSAEQSASESGGEAEDSEA